MQHLLYCPNTAGCQTLSANTIPKQEAKWLLERKTPLLFCNQTVTKIQPYSCLLTSGFFRKWVGEETSLVLPSLPQFSRTTPIFSCTSFQKPKYNSADHLQIFLAPEPTLHATTSSINHKTFCMPAGTNHPNYRLLFREASTVQKYRGLNGKKKKKLFCRGKDIELTIRDYILETANCYPEQKKTEMLPRTEKPREEENRREVLT